MVAKQQQQQQHGTFMLAVAFSMQSRKTITLR